MYLSNPYEYGCMVASVYGNLLIDLVTELADMSEHSVLFALLDKVTIRRAPTDSTLEDKLPGDRVLADEWSSTVTMANTLHITGVQISGANHLRGNVQSSRYR